MVDGGGREGGNTGKVLAVAATLDRSQAQHLPKQYPSKPGRSEGPVPRNSKFQGRARHLAPGSLVLVELLAGPALRNAGVDQRSPRPSTVLKTAGSRRGTHQSTGCKHQRQAPCGRNMRSVLVANRRHSWEIRRPAAMHTQSSALRSARGWHGASPGPRARDAEMVQTNDVRSKRLVAPGSRSRPWHRGRHSPRSRSLRPAGPGPQTPAAPRPCCPSCSCGGSCR